MRYALLGKEVILSSRNRQQLEDVQKELVETAGRDKAHFPILPLDIEEDSYFSSAVKVFFLPLSSLRLPSLSLAHWM